MKSGCAWIHVAHEPVVPKDVIDILHKYISGKLLIIKGKSILKKNQIKMLSIIIHSTYLPFQCKKEKKSLIIN